MASLTAPSEGLPPRQATPGWLRPGAIAAVAAVHALLLLGLNLPNEPDGAALPPIEVEIVPQGDPARQAAPLGAEQASETVSDASDAREVTPTDAPVPADDTPERFTDPPREVAETTPPERLPDGAPPEMSDTPVGAVVADAQPDEIRPAPPQTVAIVPPLREAPEAEILPVPARRQEPRPTSPVRATQATPDPRPDPTQAERRETRRAEEAAARREVLRREREAERRREAAVEARERAAERATQARRATAQAAARAGSASGGGGATTPSAGAVSSAAYGALVAAELNRRKRYPETARAAAAQGVVMVSFVVGSSGRVASHAITRSSGHAALDGAVSQMMAAVQLPPPPGGTFRASAPVRFNLAQ